MANKSTQQFVGIHEIKDNVLILKDGSLRQLVEVGSTNFELKSQDEQMAILRVFQQFLNALDFSLEIMVMSRKLDIDPYLKTIDEIIEKQQNELLRIQAVEYSRFVKELTQLSNIMSKNFYVAVPFYIAPISKKGGAKGILKGLLKPSQIAKELSEQDFESYKIQLGQRVNLIIENLASLGLAPRVVQRDELANLFYKFYNPEATEEIKLENAAV